MTAPRPRRGALLAGGLALLALALPAGRAHAARTVYAVDATALAKALAAALPGDTIVLTGSSYSGNFSATRAGTQAAPVVVQAVTTLRATISGTFTVAAADVTLRGLVVRQGITLNGDRARASRCKVDASGAADAVRVAGGTGVVVEFCELTNFASQAVDVLGPARSPRVYRNWVHGQGVPPTDDGAAIIVGTGKATSAVTIGALVLENRVEALNARQAIETKSSGNRIEGNTVVGGAKPGDILVRHGLDNVLVRNWVQNGRVLVGDERSVAVRNRTSGSRYDPVLGVKAGDITGDQLRAGVSGYPISEDARVITQEAVDEIGWRYEGWDLKPLRTSVEAQDRATWPVRPSFVDPDQVAYSDATSWGPTPAAPVELTTGQVGPFAPQP
jgi:hypothetical protein